jgi:hypothetical protein
MVKKTPKASMEVFRFSITSAGPKRTKRQLSAAVEAARKEALKRFRKKHVKAKAEPEGAFLAAGLEWVWLLHVSLPYLKAAGTAVATGAGTAAGKKLFDYFAKALRKRNILPGEPKVVPGSTESGGQKPQPKRKTNTKPRKK